MNIEELKAQFTAAMGELKAAIKDRDQQIADHGKAAEATGAKIATLDEKLQELAASYKSAIAKVGNLEKELSDVVVKGNRPGQGGLSVKSLGEQFVDSPQYTAMKEARATRSDSVKIEDWEDLRTKALTTDVSSAGALINPFRVPGIFSRPARTPRLRDLLVTNNTDESSVEYVEEVGFYHLAAALTAQAASGQKDLAVVSARGFYEGQTVTIDAGKPSQEDGVVDSVDHATNTVTLKDNLVRTHLTGVFVTSDDFIYTPETELKPRANATFNLAQESMKTLAHWLPASRQILNNRNMLRQHIDTRLLEGLYLSEEKQILYGDGSTDQLQGILTNPRVQTYQWSNGATGDSKIDAVRRAITLAQLAHYPVDGVVLNPADWEDIELAKGVDGHYIWVQVTEGGQPRLWRVPVVVSTAINPGDFLVGAFALGAALWDRENPTIRVADQHEDYFVRNMVAILAEQEMALTTYRPDAFVYGRFDAAPEAPGNGGNGGGEGGGT